jgi:hypothetical protein
MAGVEKENNVSIKEILLVGFVLVSVALVFVLWFNSFSARDLGNPYFYRELPTQSESFGLTRTIIAGQAMLGTGTPMVESMQQKPTPTSTPVPALLITPESDG